MDDEPLLSVDGSQGTVELYQDKIRIDRRDVGGLISTFVDIPGDVKTIPISEVTGITVSKHRFWGSGYIHIHQQGYEGSGSNAWKAMTDENTLTKPQLSPLETFKEEFRRVRGDD